MNENRFTSIFVGDEDLIPKVERKKMKTFKLFFISAILIGANFNYAQSFYNDNPLVATYSIVARDPVTGEMGVAVQSHWFLSDQ